MEGTVPVSKHSSKSKNVSFVNSKSSDGTEPPSGLKSVVVCCQYEKKKNSRMRRTIGVRPRFTSAKNDGYLPNSRYSNNVSLPTSVGIPPCNSLFSEIHDCGDENDDTKDAR